MFAQISRQEHMTETTFRPPANACDSGAHIYGPFDRYPLPGPRSTAEATLEEYLAMLRQLGFDRGVITQPSHYGTDNACLLDALARADGALKGVVTLAPDDLTPGEITRLDSRGVRGFRIHWGSKAWPSAGDLEAVAARLRGTGWFIELAVPPLDELLAHRARIENLGVPVLLGAMGQPQIARGIEDASFATLLAMLRTGSIWVKLTLPYGLADHPYEAALPFVRALVATNPARCVFAMSWPYIKGRERPPLPDGERLVALLPEWVVDSSIQKTILVDNPAQLYRF